MVQLIKKRTLQFSEWLIGLPLLGMAILASIVSWYISYANNLHLTYNDSMSHLNIARLVIDNQEPGFSQIGSVWLPLNHILPIIFVWNDTLWRTGLAASLFSMASYVIAVVAVYKTVVHLTKNRIAAVIGALALGVNINMLYLQTTPLTEPLYVALFALTVYFFAKYLTTNNTKYLPMLGFIGFLQVTTRYDGWFVTGIMGLIIIANEFILKRKHHHESLGKLLLFALPVGLGMGMWLLWNALIFGDPFYFALGEYSARAQQNTIEQSADLITKGDVITSTLAYYYAMRDNVGIFILILALVGAAVFVTQKVSRLTDIRKGLFIALLASPIVFNVIALFLGFSIINIPDLNWNPSGAPEGYWFNVRYGILALPFAAVLIGLFASWKRLAAIIAIEVLILQMYVFSVIGAITITDGTIGSSAFRNTNAAHALATQVKQGEVVMMSMSNFNPVAFESGLPLRQFVHEGVSRKWHKALQDPAAYASYVVMSSKNDGEMVRRSLLLENKEQFLKRYELVYEDNEAAIYRLKINRVAIVE